MRITNKYNLPQPVVDYARYVSGLYDGPSTEDSAISVTTLIKPLRMLLLRDKLDYSNIEKDVTEILATSNGSAIHKMFSEAMLKSGHRSEERITGSLNVDGQRIYISGSSDLIIDGQLFDLKTTSVYRYLSNDIEDYKLQLSIYRWLFEVRNPIGIILFSFTDWSSSKARSDTQYPQTRWAHKEINLYTGYEVVRYIINKIRAYREHKENDTLPLCTDEELWKNPTTYKVYKSVGAKTAIRGGANFTSFDEANRFMIEKGAAEVRCIDSKAKRCNYCEYTSVCTQYSELKMLGYIQEF
jgi:hypothetical protein